MKIERFEISVVNEPNTPNKWLFLKLTTDDGVSGCGECSWHGGWHGLQGRQAVFVENLKQILPQFVLGKSPFNIERLRFDFCLNGHDSRRTGSISSPSFSAIEMACWDIIGQVTGQPIYNLLGGRVHDRLRSYSYLPGPHRGVDPQAIAARALEQIELGYTAIKIDPVGSFCGEEMLGRLDEVEAIIRAVRTAIGSRGDILLGTHGQFDTHTAIRFAKRLEPYELAWFEEPVQTENVDEMARVARSTSIPIATGERLLNKFEFVEVLEKQAAAILQMDPSICGGLLEAKKIATLAECHYAVIAPHMYGGPLSLAASIQLDTCTTNFFLQERNVRPFHDELLEEPITWTQGYLIPSIRPGLGVTLNDETVAKHAVVQFEGTGN